jgi:integrase
MARRRNYGSGSVYQRTTDRRWVGTIEAGYTRTGARRRVTVTANTEADAKRKLRDKRLALERDGGSTSKRTTVKQWADEWLPIVERKVRPKTYSGHHSAVTRWIVPAIGHVPLEAITPRDIRKVESTQRAEGLTSSSALRTHAVLMRMLKAAQTDGHAVPARIFAMDRPTKEKSDRTAIPIPDALRLLEVAYRLPHFTRWYAALLFGMRQGECLGLTWDQVDLDAEQIAVSWQLQALPYLDRAAGTFRVPDGYEVRRLYRAQHLVRPKTESGYRLVPAIIQMADALREWRRVAPESPHGLVWPRLDGHPADVKDDLDEWKALQDTAGIRHPSGRHYVLHEARNTTATLLMEAHVPNVVITSIMGHSSIVVSQGYMHVGQGPAREAMEAVASRLQLAT